MCDLWEVVLGFLLHLQILVDDDRFCVCVWDDLQVGLKVAFQYYLENTS
jgi:hypothetical protein